MIRTNKLSDTLPILRLIGELRPKRFPKLRDWIEMTSLTEHSLVPNARVVHF